MVRETRYLLVGNLPEKTTEDAVAEHFKRYGKIQSVKLHEGSSAIVAFGDIKSASKAHGAENKIDGNVLSTEYSEGSATGSAVTRTVEQRPGYSRPYSRSKGSEDGESFDSYYSTNRYSGSYGDEIYNRGRPRERFSGRGTFKSYDTRGGFHGRVKSVDQSSQDGFEKPKVPQSPAHSTSHSGSRHSSKYKKKKQVSRSGSQSSSSSSSSNSTSSSASRSSSRSSSRCSASRGNALPAAVKTSYRTESQESNNSDKTGANDDDKRPRGIIIHHLPMRSTDTSLRDGLFHEYKKYGKVNAVLVAGVGDDRYAVVSFRKPEDAIKALSASQDKVFFGSKIKVAQHEGIEVDDNEFRPPEAELDEHHPKATRTLFVGNLEKDISNQELRERFLKYGDILDIDVKRQGAVSAYAFVQFTDIRSVVKVLREMEGEVWGSMKLKLGFGKSMPTNCVWLDNVDQTVQENFLSRQFGRYGQVTHGIIDRIKGKALVYFTNAEQAQYALVEMRNRILNNKKIMIDFASRDCQAEFYEQMEKNGQLKAGLRPDERRGWMYNRQTAEGQWEASYDNRPANFFKFSPGFRGRGSRTAGRGGSRGYKEEFSDEYRRTRSYEDYRYPGDSDDFEQDLRAYQRERQHGSQSPPPYIEEVYEDPAYRRSKDYYKYAESYRSGSPHSDRAFEGYDYDKIRLEEKYYGKERYVVRERSPEVEYSRRSWSHSPSRGAPGQIKENVGRNTPPTPMDDEARDFSRDVSPMEEGQAKFGDSKNKRRSEDDFNINEADIAELTGRPKFPGMYRTDSSPWTEDKFERKRSYDETFGQDYMKSPRKLDRQLSNKSALERIEFSKRDLYQKFQIIQSRITEKLKGRNESSPSSASSGSEPGQVNESELSKLQHEKSLLLEKLKQLDKESSTSDIEEAFDSDDPRKALSKRARMDPVGPWGDSVHHLQTDLGGVSNIKSYDYKGLDSTSSVRKQPDNLHEKERNKSCTRSSIEGSDHEEFTPGVSPKDVQIGLRKKRRKGEHSEERRLSFRSKHSEEEDHVSSDNDEVKNRFDQLSSNPVFRRLSSNHSSPRTPHFSHESSNALHKSHKETEVPGSEGLSSSHSEEMKHHKKTESFNKSHGHRSKHRHKDDHQPPIIPLGDDFPNPELLDPRNPDRIHKSLSLPLPKFAELDANVMTSPDVNISPDNSKSESPRFSSPSSGSKNTSSPQRSPSESASTNSQENPPQEYIPEENPSDMNNDGAPVEPMEAKGEFDSDGSSDHSDHNDNFELDKISLEERIRRLDEKLNAVPLPQSSTKLASEMSSLSSNSTVVSKSDTQVSSLSRTALYSKFKINKKEVTQGTGTDVKTGESTDIAKKVTSRFSIIDQDTKRLQDKIYENYSPKPTSNLEDTQTSLSPMTPLRTKGAVKEMPAQMPNLSTLPGSLAGRLGNGAAPFPTLTVTTTTSNNGKPEDMNALDASSFNSALTPAIPEKQWPTEGCLSSKSLLKPWQMDSASVPKNSASDQSNVKDFTLGYLSEESAQRPLITPAFKKQMSDNFSRTDEKSSPKISPKFLSKSPSPSIEKKTASPTHEVSLSPKSDSKLSPDISDQKSNVPSESVPSGSDIPKIETEKNSVCNEEVKTSSDLTHDSSGISPPKSEVEPMEVTTDSNSSELKEVEGKRTSERDDDTKPKSTPPVVLTKAEVKDMSPLKLTKQSSGSKEKSSSSSKEPQKKQNQESFEEILGLNSPVVFGKRKAETEELNKSQNDRDKKDVVREQKSECNGSDSDSKELEKLPQSKKPKISETESQSSDTSPEKIDKSNSSAKSKDSQKKEKSKDSKKKEKCEGDSVKKDKNNHERKDKDKDGGRDKGTNSSSTKSQSLSSSSSSKPESTKNGKTDEKLKSKPEQKKSEKSSKVTGSTKSLDEKSKGSETSSKSEDKIAKSEDKNVKLNKEKNKASSSEHKKDGEKDKKASDHSVHRKDSKSNTTKSSSESKSKEKSKNSKEKVSVKSKDSSKTDKNTKEGTNDKNGSKVKKDEKHTDKNVKSSGEKSNTEKPKESSEGKEKSSNSIPSEKQAKPSKTTDSENKAKNSSNVENTERNKEKSPSTTAGSETVTPTDQQKDKVKVKHEKSGKSKHKDDTKSKTKEKHLNLEKSKDKVSKDGKSSHKKEENRTESRKDSSEKKTEAKTEQTESSKSNGSGSNEKNDDKKSENTDGKMETKNHQADSNKKKPHESDKIHKVYRDKPKSSSSSVSDDIMKGEPNKYSKESEKSKPSKSHNKSKDGEKSIKTESKLNKSEGEKKKSPKVITEKKKSNKENKSEKSGTSKKKDKKEETEEHTSSEAAKKADDDFDWDAWQEPYVSMYDKVKRRSTIKDKEREMEQNRQKQLDKLQERRQKKSKSNSILQSDNSSTNYTDSDEKESPKKPFNKRRSKSKKIYSSSDSDSDFTSSIFPSEKKLQPQKPTVDPSKKTKKTPFLDIYSSDSDESTDSSFSAIPVTKKKAKPVKRDTSIESDDMFPIKSKNSNKKEQPKSKPKTSYKPTSEKKKSICSIYSSSDESDDSDSDLDFGKKFNRAKGNNFRTEEKKPLQKSNKIYSSSDSESAEEPDIIPAPKPISLPSKSPKDKKKGKKILDDEVKKHVNDSRLTDRKTSSDRETSKSSVISQTVHEKDIRADSLLDSMEKVAERNKKEKLAKKNKKKEKENILVGEGKLEIGKNSQFGLFEKMETFMMSDTKDRSSSKEQKSSTEEAFKNKVKDLQSPSAQDQVKKQKDKKKKSESRKDRDIIKKQPALISPIMSPVNEFSNGININDCKTDVGNVIVDEIPLEENSVLMDHPCSMENDNARSMWDSSDETFAEHQRNESLEKEKMSSLSSATDDLQPMPEKGSSDAEDSKSKKMKKKKVVKDGEVPRKTKKMDKDGSKPKKKKNKNKTCSEVDKTIDDVSKGKDILQSSGTEEPENHKIENTHTDHSDVDLDFSTPLFGNFVPEKIKPNRPSAKERVGDEDTVENEVSGEGERITEPTESELDSKAGLQEPSPLERTAENTANLKDVENKTSTKKDSGLVLSPPSHVTSDLLSPLQDVDKSLGKELNNTKSADSLWKEMKASAALNVSTSKLPESSPSQKKKSSKNELSGRSDIFDFNDDEEEVFDKIKPRHNAERDNSLKSKTSDSNKTPFKWDIGDITSKDTKTSFEPKHTNKMVNHKQESLFASWAKSLAESHEKDQNINKSVESIMNKLPKKHTSIKKQPKAQQKHEKADAHKDSTPQEVVAATSRDNVSCDSEAIEKGVICKNLEVDKFEKEEKENVAKKLEEENNKIAETLEAVSTIELLHNEEKRDRENDMFGDEGSLVIDETNPCLPETTEQPAEEQEPPQADSETALAIQSILGLGEEDTAGKLHDYSEPEPVVETPVSSHQPEENPVTQDLIEESHRDEAQLASSLIQEPMQEPVIHPTPDFTLKSPEHIPAPKPVEQIPPINVSLPPQKEIQTMTGLHDLKPKTPRGKKQTDIRDAQAQQRSYQQLVMEDPLQDMQNKDDSDDGALHIATDLPPLPQREEQGRKVHHPVEHLEPMQNMQQLQNMPQEFEIPSAKKTKTRRKKSGKGIEEPSSLPVPDLKANSVFEPTYNLPVSIRPEQETEVNTGQEVSGFASPPFAGDKVLDDKEISMSDYTDSERNDDGDLGGDEPKRPQRGASRRKNYKKMSGISPRNNSPRSRTSPRSPRIASPKQLSPKSDIATPVVKIERLPMTNKNLKLDEEQAPKEVQLPITPVKETVPVKDSGVRRGRSAGTAIETPQKTLNVYDFDEVEPEEQNAPIPKRRSSSRKKKNSEEGFDAKDSGKVLKSEIMETGIKMTIRPTVRPSKDIPKEKAPELQRLNETRVAPIHETILKEPVPNHPVDEKKAMKPRDIMSAEHRARAHSFANELVKPPAETEHCLAVAPQPTTVSTMSNIDRIIDNVSKGIFDAADGGEVISPQQLNKFTTPLTVDIGAYERKRTASRGSFTEELSLKSPSMKSPSMRSPQLSGTSPAFQLPTGLVKTPPSSISAVNPMYQSKINAIMPNTMYPGHMAELHNREQAAHHLMPSTPTATSSPISTQSSVIGTMANKMDIHVTMTMPHLTNNAGRVPAHMSGTLGKPVSAQKEIGMNLTKSAFESAPTSVLSTVSSSSIGRSVIASAHSQLAQNSTVVGVRTQQRAQPNNAAVENSQRMQHISPHLPNQNPHAEEKPGMVGSVSVGERQQQSVTSAPTCVVHPITTTSLSKQPHNMPTMIQPPGAGERFFTDPKLREGLTKEQLQRLPYHQIMQEMQQHQAQKANKTLQKQPDIGKESPQRPPSAHSNQHKQMLPGEAHVRMAQEQAAYLAMHDQIRNQILHKQGFYWPHPHLPPASVKSDEKKQEVKTTSPKMHQQSNIIAASSQHPQIKSPALAQTAPSIPQMGHQPVTNTSLANINKKTADKNAAMRWANEMVISAHEGPKSRPPSHEPPRASPREHWTQPSNIPPSQMGLKPAHQPPEHNAPMSQKEHIKKKRAEERKQQELEEMHYQRQRELQFIEKQIQMEQANALHKPSSSTSNQPTDMRQTAHVPGQQRPDGQVDGKNLIDPRFVQHPLYPGMPDMRRPSSQNPSAFTPPISGSDISPAIPAHKNYAEIQQQLYQQHPHLYNVALDPQFHLLTSGLPSHYLPRPGGLSIQDLTDPAQSGRSRSPPRVQNVPVSSQTSSKHREQEDRMVPMHETPMHMQPRVIQEAPAPGGEGSLLSLLQRYPVMWQGVLALKNDQCVVQLHMINGYEQLVKLSLPQQGPDGSVQPLRIAQRMRLEAAQLDGVIKRMKFDNDYCMLLALPCGRDHDHIIEQTRAMTTGFIQYLQQKQAAGIVNVAEPETQQPAYVVHIFPPCDFSRNTLERLGFDLMQPLRDLAHLLVIITTVA